MQQWNGVTNALNQLRDVKQISFEFVPEYSLSNVWSSAGRLFQIRGAWMAKLRSPYFGLVLGTTSCLQQQIIQDSCISAI